MSTLMSGVKEAFQQLGTEDFAKKPCVEEGSPMFPPSPIKIIAGCVSQFRR